MFSLSDEYQGQHTPFICLKGRLSQVWLETTICVFVVYIVKLVLLKRFLNLSIIMTRDYTLNSCTILENSVSALLSTPHEAATLANEIIVSMITSFVDSIFRVCDIFLLATKNLILFLIEVTIGTWVCLTVSLFNIAANEALDVAQSTLSGINTTISDAANEVADFVEKVEDLINGATGLISQVTKFMTGGKALIAQVNVSLNSLRSISIPNDVTTRIDHLKGNIPTYGDAQKAVSNVLSIPLDAIHNEISAVRNTSTFSINRSLLKVPPKRSISICDPNTLSMDFELISNDIAKCINVFIGLCALLIVLSLLWRAYSIYHRWIRLDTMARNLDTVVGRTAKLQSAANLSAISFATMTGVGSKLSMLLMHYQGSKPAYLWFIQYTMNENALGVLGVGTAGAAISLIEYAVLLTFRESIAKLEHVVMRPIVNATDQVVMDMFMWEGSVNLEISQVQAQINSQILGWVHNGTLTMNNTLNAFMHINGEINTTLGGSGPVYSAMSAVVTCVLGNKVAAVEKGLTWVHKHSQVSLPVVNISANSVVSPAVNSTGNFLQSKLGAVDNTLHSQIITQVIVSAAFIGAWLTTALIGVCYVLAKPEIDARPPWSAKSEKTFDIVTSPVYTRRATRFLDGPERKVQYQSRSTRQDFSP